MFKKIKLFLFLILLNSSLFAQDWNEIYYLEGEAQYLIEENEYEKAIDVYRRMIKEVPNHSFAKYKIGQLYLMTDDQKSTSIEYLEEASQDIALDFNEKSLREVRTPVDVLLYLGEAYQIENRIDEAIVIYNNFKNLITPENEFYPTVLQRLNTCKNALAAFKNPLRVSSKNLGEPVNDENPNFSAVLSGNGETLIFTSYTRNYIDNYQAQKVNGVWGSPKKISEKISGKYYLKTSSLSFDGEELYLVTDDPEQNELFVSVKQGKEWTDATKLPKTINGKKSNETHACISKDKKKLFFTSDREGGSGGLDIYMSTIDAKGNWGEPVNLGPDVNTAFDEETPFVTLDDKYLFFSSKGHNSIGGFDIFYIDLQNQSIAVNLGYPANTSGDDLFFVPDNSLTSGYISRYDNTSVGKKDIYYLSVVSQINIAGIIKNALSGENIDQENISVSILETQTNNLVETINSEFGTFKLEVVPGEYTVVINNENFEAFTDKIKIPDNFTGNEFLFEASLKPIEKEEELLAAVIEEPVTVQVIEEPVIEKPVEKEIIKPEVKAVKEEKKPEPIVEEKIIEKPKTEEKLPEKEVIKYIPVSKSTVSNTEKTYSVQLMALKKPIDISFFKNVDGVKQKLYEDGYYRYTVGNTKTYAEALKLKEKINKAGYKDIFIRVNNITPKYTIQIMALIIPVEVNYFENLSFVIVTKGADDYYRYTIGDFTDYGEAKQELGKLAELGYKKAYVKRSN
ncbi:MAG: hypothetical protein KOO66_13165 [Bacteroidales bacterium]|nr:hypothetical protein [Bacteroidales bacterium]